MRFVLVFCALLCIFSVPASPTLAADQAQLCINQPLPPVAGPLIPPPTTNNIIVINEIQPYPDTPTVCQTNTKQPWIELYNPQNQAYDLYADHAFIDTGENTYRFYVLPGAAIASHSYFTLVLPAQSLNGLPTFRLLLMGILIDQVTIPTLTGTQSYARIPDGANTWSITNTVTINSSNTPPPVLATPSITPTPRHHKQAQPTPQGNTLPTTTPTITTTATVIAVPGSSGAVESATGSPGKKQQQPQWGTLQFPGTANAVSPAGTIPAGNAASSPSSTDSAGIDVAQIGLLCLCVSFAVGMVLYYRRNKRSP